MSRLDKFDEILDGFKDREYESMKYIPDTEGIKKIYEILIGCREYPSTNPKMCYIASEKGKFKELTYVSKLENMEYPEFAAVWMQKALEYMEEKNLQISGVVYYTGNMHPLGFVQKENIRGRKHVPGGVDMPDFMLIIDIKGRYSKYTEFNTHPNVSMVSEVILKK